MFFAAMPPILLELLASRDGGVFVIGGIVLLMCMLHGRRPCRPRCGRCHEMNRPEAVFCAQCGDRLAGR